MKPILLFVPLAAALYAQAAHALDVSVKALSVYDAETGESTKLMVGRKLLIRCQYEYDALFQSVPSWQIQLQLDGKTIGTYNAAPPTGFPSFGGWTMQPAWVDAFVNPTTLGP